MKRQFRRRCSRKVTAVFFFCGSKDSFLQRPSYFTDCTWSSENCPTLLLQLLLKKSFTEESKKLFYASFSCPPSWKLPTYTFYSFFVRWNSNYLCKIISNKNIRYCQLSLQENTFFARCETSTMVWWERTLPSNFGYLLSSDRVKLKIMPIVQCCTDIIKS